MITQVSIKNFKCLRDVTVDLERFTVFVGANGSGKTSFLQAMDLLCRTFRGQSQDYDGEYSQHRSFGVMEPVELGCRVGDTHLRYRTRRVASQLHPNVHQAKWNGEGVAFTPDGPQLDWRQWQAQPGVLPNPVWLRLDPNALRAGGGGNHSDPRLMSPQGQGLHSATASMNLEDPDLWLKLQDDLRRIVPSIKRLRHTPQNQLLFDTVNGKGLNATQISEGTLLTLGLLTAIHGVN